MVITNMATANQMPKDDGPVNWLWHGTLNLATSMETCQVDVPCESLLKVLL